MGYKVRINFGYRIKDYGTGELGKGKAYKTKKGAEKRAAELAKIHRRPTKVIRSNN